MYANLSKAVENGMKFRPVVVFEESGNRVKVFSITSRMISSENNKDGNFVKMNSYKTKGWCDVGTEIEIDKKYLNNMLRECTTTEMDAIQTAVKNRKFYKQVTGK